MKTVSTKLDAKSHEYLLDVANKDGTTVSDYLRNMVDRLIQNEGRPVTKCSDDSRRQQIRELESEMNNFDRLQDIPEHKKAEHIQKIWIVEDKLHSLLDEEYYFLEESLVDILEQKSWVSNGDDFLEYIEKHDISSLEALDDAIDCYLKYRRKVDQEKILRQL